jgi:hypothetical protein
MAINETTIETVIPVCQLDNIKELYFSTEILITQYLLELVDKSEENKNNVMGPTKLLTLNSDKFPVGVRVIFSKVLHVEKIYYGFYIQLHKKYFVEYGENEVELTMIKKFKDYQTKTNSFNLKRLLDKKDITDWGFPILISDIEINNISSVQIFLHE